MHQLPLDPNYHEFKNKCQDRSLLERVEFWLKLTKPKNIIVLQGSAEEEKALADLLVKKKIFLALNPKKRPNSFYCRSDPKDVARDEKVTFICTKNKEDAGATNNWEDPKSMRKKIESLFDSAMHGRDLYIIPYLLGPKGSIFSQVGIEITDSAYVAYSMMQMTRVDLNHIRNARNLVLGVHTVGAPLRDELNDSTWPCNEKKLVAHFPETREVFSFGSGYGGNALLAKKCHALRLASFAGKEEGFLAEHMLIVSITNPKGKKHYIAAAFPSACGKTNLALMRSRFAGWKVQTVGDDIAWLRIKEDGRLWAINPEFGFFGVAPGTNYKTNPNMMETVSKNTVFTNVALTQDLDVWWEGMSDPPDQCTDWLGNLWKKGSDQKAAHPNSRFTVNIKNCPSLDPSWNDPEGVPISAILFGGRRSSFMPLVFEANNWQSGIFFGASMRSEKTAAQVGKVGELRHDPFAMLPFCGYNMAKYFAHLHSFEKKTDPKKLPRIYSVNWFLKKGGEFLWPGFDENLRVMQWIFERIEGSKNAKEHPFGQIPENLNLENLSISKETIDALFYLSPSELKQEIDDLRNYFSLFGSDLPSFLDFELKQLQNRWQQM